MPTHKHTQNDRIRYKSFTAPARCTFALTGSLFAQNETAPSATHVCLLSDKSGDITGQDCTAKHLNKVKLELCK